MNCESIQEDLSAYHDGELMADQTAAVEQHLASCRNCREELDRMRNVWDLLGTLPTVQPSPDFKARFWEKARREEERLPWWAWLKMPRFAPALAGAMALWILGVAGGVRLYERHSQVTPTSRALGIFTAAYPPNSIEGIYLKGTPGSHL